MSVEILFGLDGVTQHCEAHIFLVHEIHDRLLLDTGSVPLTGFERFRLKSFFGTHGVFIAGLKASCKSLFYIITPWNRLCPR